MGDPAAPPLDLGFMKEIEKQEIEIEQSGSRSAAILDLARGIKRPPSPLIPGDEVDSPTATTRDEWLLSDTGSEEDDDNQDTNGPFTVADFPRASSDFKKQNELLYGIPQIDLRGPPAIMLFPPFNTGKRTFDSEYNLADKSEITVRDVRDCSNECRCLLMDVLQFVSVKIAGYRHTRSGPAKIFGFVAARETEETSRNYVYRHDIDNGEAVTVKSKTGVARLSLISPARVILFQSHVLIEFELHAQSDEEKDGDNGPIIEGCTELYNLLAIKSFSKHNRIYGERCALDIKYLVLINALEAQVDVKVLRLGAIPGGVNMKLCAKTSGFDEVICLFRGAAPDPGNTMSFTVAAEWRRGFDLYTEGYAREGPFLGRKPLVGSWWRCFFAAEYHAIDERVATLGEFATFSVKVTWRTHRKSASIKRMVGS